MGIYDNGDDRPVALSEFINISRIACWYFGSANCANVFRPMWARFMISVYGSLFRKLILI